MITELESRAVLYATLALGFAYPETDDEFAAVAEPMERAVHSLQWADDLRTAIRNLRSAINSPPAPIARAEEHTYLFHRQVHCPPYELSYCPAGMEQSLADIAGFYRAFGLQAAPEAHERVDHIGSELEFMAVLCAKEARADRQGLIEQAAICRAARRAFLTDHLGRWAATFAARLRDKARLPFYPALAEMLMALLTREAAELGTTLSPVLEGVAEAPTEMEGEPCG